MVSSHNHIPVYWERILSSEQGTKDEMRPLAFLIEALLLIAGCVAFKVVLAKPRTKPPREICFSSAKRIDVVGKDVFEVYIKPAASVDKSQFWMREGLLISSFSEGLVPNEQARDYLRRGFMRCLLMEVQQAAEEELDASVRSSPCNGPNMEAMQHLEQCDGALQKQLQDATNCAPSSDFLRRASDIPTILRFVYIPTAAYALRTESDNTPGKQRQRARADGKQRRDEIVRLLQDLLGYDGTISVAAVTLDLDDGSIKQPEVTINSMKAAVSFPANGQDALRDWRPQ